MFVFWKVQKMDFSVFKKKTKELPIDNRNRWQSFVLQVGAGVVLWFDKHEKWIFVVIQQADKQIKQRELSW